METITEDTVRQLMEQVKKQQEVIAAQQVELSSLSKKMNGSSVSVMKPPKPEVFKGRRDATEINSWIDQVYRYGQVFKLSSAQVSDLAVFYLSGPARDWWTNQTDVTKARLLSSWDEFCKDLKKSFYPIDHERKTMDAIEKLSQKGSVAKYVEKFEHLRSQIQDVPVELWKRYFIKGLSHSVKIEAIKYNVDKPDATLEDLYQRSTTIGDALWDHRTQHQHDSYRNDPMDLSSVNLKKPNGKAYAGQNKARKSKPISDNRTCYLCGETGHIQRNCKSKMRLQSVDTDGLKDDVSHSDFQ